MNNSQKKFDSHVDIRTDSKIETEELGVPNQEVLSSFFEVIHDASGNLKLEGATNHSELNKMLYA